MVFDASKRYLLACSFGPDSMALFGMLLDEKIDFEVAHVNYQMRGQESDTETERLEKFCAEKSIKFHHLSVDGKTLKGNFEAAARCVRYEYFSQLFQADETLDILLTGHNEDDNIETYLMQIQRQKTVNYYGIRRKTRLFSIYVERPLLGKSKADLQTFCEKNSIPYTVDSSNLVPLYTRNRLRIDYVTKLSKNQRAQIIIEIDKMNESNENDKAFISAFIDGNNEVRFDDLNSLETRLKHMIIFHLFDVHGLASFFTSERAKSIAAWGDSKNPNITQKITEKYSIVKEYGVLKIITENVTTEYSFVLDKPGVLSNEFFYLDLASNLKRFNINEASFPVAIRSPLPNDVYKIKSTPKQLRRLFIDWKLSLRLRKLWPVFVDCNGDIVFVPRYRRDYVVKDEELLKIMLR